MSADAPADGGPGEVIVVAPELCVGAAQCVLVAPELFDQSEEGTVVLLDERPATPELRAAVAEAARICPARAIDY
ncbi:ferredoxin [Kitasatospora sp. NPDC101235]|uniref:ferredoxin n=1 Tax=Kitasatospora sp. NPDC101235 TaxID=3364101 RepID=UPI003813FC5E